MKDNCQGREYSTTNISTPKITLDSFKKSNHFLVCEIIGTKPTECQFREASLNSTVIVLK